MIPKKILAKYRRFLSNHRAHIPLASHLSALECNRKIGAMLRAKTPFFVGRLGWIEGDALGRFLIEGSVPDKIKDPLGKRAGVFPLSNGELKKFSEIYCDALSKVDILGQMPAPYQGWLTKSYASKALITDISSIEPYFCHEPWSYNLQGLKVLVVHPFTESIFRQYTTLRKKLFANPKILPEFTLKLIKAPQTINSHSAEYASWSETLEALRCQVKQEDFDVAIIGCGAYGFPLAATVKEIGKIALHLGGATQLLFGIRGKRWNGYPEFQNLMTDTWRFPLETERPVGWQNIEEGCYW